jgi:polysaccharide biosynthesis/export protein
MKTSSLLLLLALPLFFSCSSYKQLTYLHPLPEGKDSVFLQKRPLYHLQPSDILYVRIISNNKEVSDLYNPMLSSTTSAVSQQGGMYILGFLVSDSGTVNLPILGKIEVIGLTIDEAQEKIQFVTNKYLTDALAVVKLAQYKFTVLGEVNSPGYKIASGDRINIFEAISIAGDLTYSAKRNKIMVIRQELPPDKKASAGPGSGIQDARAKLSPTQLSTHTYQLDLTSPGILTSDAYFIQPNDIIYVKPTYMHALRTATGDFLILLGTLASAVTGIYLLTKL